MALQPRSETFFCLQHVSNYGYMCNTRHMFHCELTSSPSAQQASCRSVERGESLTHHHATMFIVHPMH